MLTPTKAGPLIPWIGGKRRLAARILPILSAIPHTCYVEPFAGAAAIFFARADRAKAEVLNDLNGDLVNLYRVVQHHLDEFVRQFRWGLASRQMFAWAQRADADGLTDIQRAARFFYLQKLGFGGKVVGRSFGTATTAPARLNLLRIEEDLSEAHLRLTGVTIEHLPWLACVDRYDRPHTAFFCDPPYWGTAGYGTEFGLEQYDEMASVMAACKGAMVVTVNDIPEMRSAFRRFRMERVAITYSVSRQESGRAPTGELIICNR